MEHIHEVPHMIQKLVPNNSPISVLSNLHKVSFLYSSPFTLQCASISPHLLSPSIVSLHQMAVRIYSPSASGWAGALNPRRKSWFCDENLNAKNCFILAHMHTDSLWKCEFYCVLCSKLGCMSNVSYFEILLLHESWNKVIRSFQSNIHTYWDWAAWIFVLLGVNILAVFILFHLHPLYLGQGHRGSRLSREAQLSFTPDTSSS